MKNDGKRPKIFDMAFADIYPLYMNKVERKGRTKAELDIIILWLTGYDADGFEKQLAERVSNEQFFDQAPHIHDNAILIKGLICGYRIEEIEDDLMRKIRYLDKLVDELAKGKAVEKILRT